MDRMDRFVGYIYRTHTQFLAIKTLNSGLYAFDERAFETRQEAEWWLRSIGCTEII